MVSDSNSAAPDRRLPRYLQIRDELLRRIVAREWAVGQALPAEDKLAAAFSVSLGTMRQALQTLVTDGAIERVHGRGTFVSRTFERLSMSRFTRFRGVKENELPVAHILSVKVCDEPLEIKTKLGLSAKDKLLCIHRTRSYDDEVILVEHIWLSKKRFAKLEKYLARHSPTLLYPIYDTVCGVLVSRAEDELSAGPFFDEDAAIFKVPPNTLGVRIARVVLDQAGQPVECRVSYVTAERFHYTAEVR